jgi:hypothetical protein
VKWSAGLWAHKKVGLWADC